MSIPSPTPELRDAAPARRATSPERLGAALVREAPPAPAPGPPGLGGLLMVVGGGLCLMGGIFIALGAEALMTISPRAATMFLKGVPLAAGGALVVIGATVRRALGRAYHQGVAAGREIAALPDGSGDLQQVQSGRNGP